MTDDLIDVTAAPHAHRTSWAYDAGDGNYVFVLENEAGEPIAFASYKFATWERILRGLVEVHEQRTKPQ